MAQADELNICLNEFDAILQPIIDSCTKDSISAGTDRDNLCNYSLYIYIYAMIKFIIILFAGKNYILQNANDGAKCNVLLEYLLKK